jgi:hypothetical protein
LQKPYSQQEGQILQQVANYVAAAVRLALLRDQPQQTATIPAAANLPIDDTAPANTGLMQEFSEKDSVVGCPSTQAEPAE